MHRHAVELLPDRFINLASVVEGVRPQSPMTSLFDAQLGSWQPKSSVVLLDSCSDAHIIFEPSAFLYVVPSDIPAILVGKEGESVSFAGMGPALLKVSFTGPCGHQKRGNDPSEGR